MSSFLSPPHPHNLSPVRIWELRGRTSAAHTGGDSCRAGSTGSTHVAEREVGHVPQLSGAARGRRERGQHPGNRAQGDCPESLGMLRNSRGKRNAIGAVIHLGCWMAGSVQNTFSRVKFSKIPSAEAFHQLLQTLCRPGPTKGPRGHQA